MKKITPEEFRFWQPYSDVAHAGSDRDYIDLASRMLDKFDKSGLYAGMPDGIKNYVTMIVMGYFCDIVHDFGVWRGFTSFCKRNYGTPVPFWDADDSYIDAELNLIDVRFMVWYALTSVAAQPPLSVISPHDPQLLGLAELFYSEMENVYEDISQVNGHNELAGVDLNDPEDAERIYNLTQWLFWHCYLLLPSIEKNRADLLSEIRKYRANDENSKAEQLSLQVMIESVTGPLALNIRDWIRLITNNDYQPLVDKFHPQVANERNNHPYYHAFVRATGGRFIKFIDTYGNLNDFFINGMGWAPGEDHLSALASHGNFVLFATPDKGLIVAPDIATCVNHPENNLYDRKIAYSEAISLLTEKGKCPPDLRFWLIDNGCITDAHFFEDDDVELVSVNADFISRCYLQDFYAGD